MRGTQPLALLVALSLTACFGAGGADGGDTSDATAERDLMPGGDGTVAGDDAFAGDDGGLALEPRFSALYSSYFSTCKNCHAPGAPGRTSDIEKTLDFSTVGTAHQTITAGMAMGLVGNPMDCNGVPFVVVPKPEQSLIVAVIDEPTRKLFDYPMNAGCDRDGISDETVKVGSAPTPAFVAALKQWIIGGAKND